MTTLEVGGEEIIQTNTGVFDVRLPGLSSVMTFSSTGPPDDGYELVTTGILIGRTSYLNIRETASAPIRRWLLLPFSDIEQDQGITVGSVDNAPLLGALARAASGTRTGTAVTTRLRSSDVMPEIAVSGIRKIFGQARIEPEELTTVLPATVTLDGRGRAIGLSIDATEGYRELVTLAGKATKLTPQAISGLRIELTLSALGQPVSITAPPAALIVSQKDFKGFK